MIVAETDLRCPYCGSDTAKEYTEEVCAMCGNTMTEYLQCKCCGEFNIPKDELEDYCDSCKDSTHKALYDFLKGNLTEKEVILLDETMFDSFQVFLEEYEEGHEIE